MRVTTPQLWLPKVSQSRRDLAARVRSMRDVDGLTFVEIAKRLNSAGVTSPRGGAFYQQVVFSIYRKWTARDAREQRLVRADLIEVRVFQMEH